MYGEQFSPEVLKWIACAAGTYLGACNPCIHGWKSQVRNDLDRWRKTEKGRARKNSPENAKDNLSAWKVFGMRLEEAWECHGTRGRFDMYAGFCRGSIQDQS